MSDLACTICHGTDFGPGPGGRMSVTGKLPYCIKCGSLERHRAFRSVFLAIKDRTFQTASVLQFSLDTSVVPGWFGSFEVSTYDGENSLDLMRIDRPSSSYDIVVCNHVLEHVQYDNSGMNELGRITKKDGFVFLSFPDPARKLKTDEWATPRTDQHYHWRVYGRDVEDRFRLYVPHLWAIAHSANDPVTLAEDRIYLLCWSRGTAKRLLGRLKGSEVVNAPSIAASA